MKVLKSLHKITSDHSLAFETKIERLLTLGSETFGLPLGIVSEIKDNVYTVKHCVSPDNSLSAGMQFDFENTFCVHTLAANQPVSFHYAKESAIANHPCYTQFKLESYIGAPLLVEGKLFGTLNFSSSELKDQPFSENEHELIDLLALWIGNEIGRNNSLSKNRKQQIILEEMGQLAGVGAWEVDLVNEQVYWSDVTRKIHEVDNDYQPDVASGINFYKEGENRQRITKCFEGAVQTGGSFNGEFEIITAKGNTKWIATQGRAEIENGQCVRVFGAFQDISKQVFYREQLQQRHKELSLALKARSMFLANMSHEIRTPMNGVLGMLQIIDTQNFSEQQTKHLSLAKESAVSLLNLINDILDFTKVDSGQLSLETIEFDINHVIESCVHVFSPNIREKSLVLQLQLDATKGKIALGDPTRVRQICSNLISNAIKFTQKGSISISTDIDLDQDQQSHLIIKIADSGIGMSQMQLKNLFKPFNQGDVSTTRKYGGTGLGLAISKNLAVLMDGDITIHSELGVGSTFTVQLKLAISENIESIDDKQTDSVKPLSLGGKRILVVEDNEINQIVVGEMLKHVGVEVEYASDGMQAIDKLMESSMTGKEFCLVLMDCQMPIMDGYEATQNIRKMQTSFTHIPIIALTANAMMGEKEKCLDSGMNDFLSKPLDSDLLYAQLQKYI